jgi:predicted O-linked N-acetylglucosamine transferase (SPINDLY family)
MHLERVADWTNFYLPYQGRNDLALQKKFGQYLSSVMESNYPNLPVPNHMPVRADREKIRIGYVSEYLYAHTVGKLFVGWAENADPTEFEVYCYHCKNVTDSVTERFKKASFQFHHIFNDRDRIVEQIVADKIHILVYLDIGMNPATQLLAALRLAPVQCVAWGHPLTTGLPTIDYFLSSDLMEPVNGQDYYSETLVKLPDLSICYSKPELPENPKKRSEFGLKDDDFVYLSTQSLFKYLPEDDGIYPEIALLVPNSRFVFLQHESENVTSIFKRRLKRAFNKHQLDAEKFCVFQPRLSYSDFLSLNMVGDVLLDPPAWSGGMTSLEGISCGLPAVTLPGRYMRSRHTYAMLKLMGIMETVADDKQDYIRIAARLGTDRKFQTECRKSIKRNVDRLYEGRAAVRALEDFYKSLLQADW